MDLAGRGFRQLPENHGALDLEACHLFHVVLAHADAGFENGAFGHRQGIPFVPGAVGRRAIELPLLVAQQRPGLEQCIDEGLCFDRLGMLYLT